MRVAALARLEAILLVEKVRIAELIELSRKLKLPDHSDEPQNGWESWRHLFDRYQMIDVELQDAFASLAAAFRVEIRLPASPHAMMFHSARFGSMADATFQFAQREAEFRELFCAIRAQVNSDTPDLLTSNIFEAYAS